MSGENKGNKMSNPYQKVIYAGAIYHVIQRAPGKDVLFLEDKDFLYFVYLLKEIKDKFALDVFCFCLMSNHLHVLLRINKANLPDAMKSLFSRYAIYFNLKYQRKGHVFYGNYKAFLCLDDRYLITASVYIHLNPYKVKLVSNPGDYRWSSLGAYINRPQKTFLDYQYVLKILSENLEKASLSYEKILSDGGGIDFKNIIEDPRSMEKFSLKLLKKIKSFLSLKKKDIYDLELENHISQFKDKRRLRKVEDLAARKYLIEQLKAREYNIKEIAQMLNLSRQSIHAILRCP